MKTKLNRFPDEVQLQVVKEYLTTEISQPELMKKYNFGGKNTIYRWMKKFGILKSDVKQIKEEKVMTF